MSIHHITEDRHPILVETKLDYDNFSIWCFRNEYALQARNLWGLVNGTETPPTNDDEGYKRWEHRDALARFQLVVNIPDKWLWTARRTASAREIWLKLHEVLQSESTLKRSLVMNRFLDERLPEGGDVQAHVQRMGNLWEDVVFYKASTSDNPDDFFAHTLLRSLPPSWSDFVSTWRVATVASDAPTPPPAVLMGHILDTDAWHRGRTESRIRRNKARRQKSSKDTGF